MTPNPFRFPWWQQFSLVIQVEEVARWQLCKRMSYYAFPYLKHGIQAFSQDPVI